MYMMMSRMHFTETDSHKLGFIPLWHIVGPVDTLLWTQNES